MKRSITRWTTSLAAAALLALPTAALAQTSGTAQPPATSAQPPASPASAQTDTAQNAAAQEHLRQARSALDAVKPAAVTGRAKTPLAELKRHLDALDRPSGANINAARGNANWGTQVAAIDKILTSLIGPTATTGSSADPTSAIGTSGTTASTRPKSAPTAVTLDEATRARLVEVRTHVTAYAVAMSGAASEANAATEPSAAKGTTGSTSATGTTGSTTGSTSATGSTTAAPQLNPEAARRHLTEARDTLTQLTQLPAAAQLSGEARAQVSQLIANFNELTAAQNEWRASYSKVDANLVALLGPDSTDAERTGGVSTGTTGTTGAPGAVGTSGNAGVSLDPAIRGKLVELRQKLNEFEKAAGGNVTASASTTSPATDPMAGTTGSMQSATPPTATQANETMGHQEAMRHIAAIGERS